MLVLSLTYMPRIRAFISDWRRSTRRGTSALFLVSFIEVLPMPRGLDGLLDDVRSRGFRSPSLGGVGFIFICCAFFIRQVPRKFSIVNLITDFLISQKCLLWVTSGHSVPKKSPGLAEAFRVRLLAVRLSFYVSPIPCQRDPSLGVRGCRVRAR